MYVSCDFWQHAPTRADSSFRKRLSGRHESAGAGLKGFAGRSEGAGGGLRGPVLQQKERLGGRERPKRQRDRENPSYVHVERCMLSAKDSDQEDPSGRKTPGREIPSVSESRAHGRPKARNMHIARILAEKIPEAPPNELAAHGQCEQVASIRVKGAGPQGPRLLRADAPGPTPTRSRTTKLAAFMFWCAPSARARARETQRIGMEADPAPRRRFASWSTIANARRARGRAGSATMRRSTRRQAIWAKLAKITRL